MTLWKDVTCQSFKPRWRADMFLMLVWFVELLMHLIFFYCFFIVLFFFLLLGTMRSHAPRCG